MPGQIVAETCPAPKCNLSPRDVEGLIDQLKTYHTVSVGFRECSFRHSWVCKVDARHSPELCPA